MVNSICKGDLLQIIELLLNLLFVNDQESVVQEIKSIVNESLKSPETNLVSTSIMIY